MMCLILCFSLMLQGCIEKSFILTLVKCLPDTSEGVERYVRIQWFVQTIFLAGTLRLLKGSYYREEWATLPVTGEQSAVPNLIPGQTFSNLKIQPLAVPALQKTRAASPDKLRFIVRLRTASNAILSTLTFDSTLNPDGSLPPQVVNVPAFVVENKQKVELAVAPVGDDLEFGTLKLRLKYVGKQ